MKQNRQGNFLSVLRMFAKADQQLMGALGPFDGMDVVLPVLFVVPTAVFVPCVMADIMKQCRFCRQVDVHSVAEGKVVGMVRRGDGVGEAGSF